MRASCPHRDTRESWKSQPRPTSGPPRGVSDRPVPPYAAVRTSSRGSAFLPASTIPRGARNTPAQARLTLQARRAPRQPAVQPRLATVTGAAEPVQVLQRERPSERLRSHRPCDVDREPVVELRGRTSASLAHRDLDAEWLLSGCDAVGCEAVVVPGEVYCGGVLVAPATDAADRRLAPARGPGNKSPGMCRRMSSVVQHQSPEPSPCPSDRSAPLLRSFNAAWLSEVPSRRASCRMASASSSSKPLTHLVMYFRSLHSLSRQRSRT